MSIALVSALLVGRNRSKKNNPPPQGGPTGPVGPHVEPNVSRGNDKHQSQHYRDREQDYYEYGGFKRTSNRGHSFTGPKD